MLSEKDIKLTINKLWKELKETNILREPETNILREPNTTLFIYTRTTQILALMKILGKEEIFSKQEIDSYNIKLPQQINIKIPEPVKNITSEKEVQISLADIPEEQLQKFVKSFNRRKNKTLTKEDLKKLTETKTTKENSNIQELVQVERI
jgi:hypothetical protein